MKFYRFALVLVALIAVCLLRAQIAQAQTSFNQSNPFEAVPKPAEPAALKPSGPTIEAIEFPGTTRNAQSALRAVLTSRVGGTYDTETLRRDVQALYATTRFSSMVSETEPGRTGVIVRLLLVERPFIQSVEFQGDYTVTIGAILERFQQRKIKLRAETLFHEDELGRAAAIIQELVTERGRRNITVVPVVEPVRVSSSVKITFRVEEKQ